MTMGLDHHYQVASMDAELVREAHSCLKCQKRDKTQAKTQAIGTGDEGYPGAGEDEECFGLNEEDGDEEEEEEENATVVPKTWVGIGSR